MAPHSPLGNPAEFFASADSAQNLKGAGAVVLATGALSVIGPLFVFSKILSQFSSGSLPFVVIGGGVGFVASFFGVFLAWFAYAGLFYIGSRYFSEAGEFRALFTAVGWGFLPALVGAVIATAVTLVTFAGVTFPSDPSLARPFVSSIRERPQFLGVSIIAVGLTLWQGLIWITGLETTAKLARREAALVVSGPVVLTVLWQLYSMA